MNKTKYLADKKIVNTQKKVTEGFKAEVKATQVKNKKAYEKHKQESNYYKYNELSNPDNPYYVGKGKKWYEGKQLKDVESWDISKHGKPSYTPVEKQEMGGSTMNEIISKHREEERAKRNLVQKIRDFIFE